MASCSQDNHFLEWAISPKPSVLFGWVKMSAQDKMVFHFCLLMVHWAAECSIAISLLPLLLWACFVLTPEAPWLLDSLCLQVSQAQSPSPNQAGLWLVGFFSLFLLLTKVQTVLNAKLKQMGEVLSRVSEHYAWPWAVPLCAQQGWRQNILCPRVSPAWGPTETQHIRAEFLEPPSICAGGEEQKARSSWSALNV